MSFPSRYSDRSAPVRQPESSRNRLTWQVALITALIIVLGLVLAQFIPAPMAWSAGLGIFCIVLWGTGLVPEYWPALVFFLIAIVFRVGTPQIVLSGFYSSTLWLFFGGLVLGASIRHTGLNQRAAVLMTRIIGQRYTGIVAGTVAFSFLLSFIIPSAMGRIALLFPIVIGLADHLGYVPGRPGRQGFLMAAFFGTILPGFTILPANAPNMVLAGMAENLYSYHLSYWYYLLIHLPVLGLLKAIILVMVILRMFPDGDPEKQSVAAGQRASVTPAEKKLIVLLGACLLGWLTDSIHHISPGWIGLAAAIICLWPESGLTSKRCLNEEINYGSLFFIAGVLGLGAVISSTGLGEALVQYLSTYVTLSPGHDVRNITTLTGISTIIGIVTNLPGVPIVMTPIARDFAHMTGLSVTAVMMSQVLAFSNIFLPYQSAPLLTAIQMAKFPLSVASRLCLILFVLTLVILIPLDLLWWKLLGIIV
jgi:di/tricarboxylate transporter